MCSNWWVVLLLQGVMVLQIERMHHLQLWVKEKYDILPLCHPFSSSSAVDMSTEQN